MNHGPDYAAYAAKMRGLAVSGCDLEGGPAQQDLVTTGSGLTLTHRFSDWHLSPASEDSPWSVSVYSNAGQRRTDAGPDGIFVLGK